MSHDKHSLESLFHELKNKNLSLDMTRGKPCSEQLDLSNALLEPDTSFKTAKGVDCRNYGGLEGIPEARSLFAEILDVPSDNVIVGGNSSLSLMHMAVVYSLLNTLPDGQAPWQTQKPKFLCPSPGYDRHFFICESLGIEMITVPYLQDGPDMDMVEKLVSADPSIKGIWCVPKYSNPTGITYSDKTVLRLAEMQTAAPDFRIFWDNAYVVHDLNQNSDPLLEILSACKNAGHYNRPIIFASTSKVTFAGAGISALAASPENTKAFVKYLGFQTIGPDKLQQLRHCKFLHSLDHIKSHMQKHAQIIKPKFEAVLEILNKELSSVSGISWTNPNGGYFISLDVQPGTARKIVSLAEEIGVKLTAAGVTFPYGRDPEDRNIRIAPTLPSLEEIKTAMEALCVCIKLASQ